MIHLNKQVVMFFVNFLISAGTKDMNIRKFPKKYCFYYDNETNEDGLVLVSFS